MHYEKIMSIVTCLIQLNTITYSNCIQHFLIALDKLQRTQFFHSDMQFSNFMMGIILS
jgi:hypothetical protein